MTSDLANVPLWAAIPAALFILIGSGLTLVGAFGLVRLKDFYDRLHAPTLGTSWGIGGLVMGSMIIFTSISGRPVLHEFLIGVFVTVTTPITLMMLGRSAVFRDRSEGNPGAPPNLGTSEETLPPHESQHQETP